MIQNVEVRRLDGLWEALVSPGDVAFLKSDTQGYDLKVLAGAGTCLSSISGLLLEVSIINFYQSEPRISEMLDHVEGFGFDPSGFFPVARRKNSLALTTIDVCFLSEHVK